MKAEEGEAPTDFLVVGEGAVVGRGVEDFSCSRTKEAFTSKDGPGGRGAGKADGIQKRHTDSRK